MTGAAKTLSKGRDNFDVIGVALEEGEPATLQHIMTGYVSHLQHHLAQIFG